MIELILYCIMLYMAGVMFTYFILDSNQETRYLNTSIFKWLVLLSWFGLSVILIAKYITKRANKRRYEDNDF